MIAHEYCRFILGDRAEIQRSLSKTAETMITDLSALHKKREYLERSLQDNARQLGELRAALPS